MKIENVHLLRLGPGKVLTLKCCSSSGKGNER